MWVLIVIYSGIYFGSLGFTQEFTTKEKCEAAATWAKARGNSAVCMEK